MIAPGPSDHTPEMLSPLTFWSFEKRLKGGLTGRIERRPFGQVGAVTKKTPKIYAVRIAPEACCPVRATVRMVAANAVD